MINLKQNDTGPPIKASLRDDLGNPLDLRGNTKVVFILKNARTGAVAVYGYATVTRALYGRVRYDWGAGDLATPGTYKGEFEITYGNGRIETCPSHTWIDLTVMPELSA